MVDVFDTLVYEDRPYQDQRSGPSSGSPSEVERLRLTILHPEIPVDARRQVHEEDKITARAQAPVRSRKKIRRPRSESGSSASKSRRIDTTGGTPSLLPVDWRERRKRSDAGHGLESEPPSVTCPPSLVHVVQHGSRPIGNICTVGGSIGEKAEGKMRRRAGTDKMRREAAGPIVGAARDTLLPRGRRFGGVATAADR